MFINDITDHLMTLLSTGTNNIILGDFNMHINDINSNDACTFLDTFTALGLTQHVKKTHMSRVIYLTSCSQRKHPTLNSPPAKLVLSYQTTNLSWPHSISIDNLLRKRNFQYINLTALPKITSKLPLTKVPLT